MARVKATASGTGKKGKASKPRLHLRPRGRCGPELGKVALLQIDAALLALHGNDVSPDSVHDARTYIKKLRAILQLASPVLSGKQRDLTTRLLREAAARLAPLRDSEVLVLTLDALLGKADLPADDYAALHAGLANVAKQHRHNDARRIPGVLNRLGELRKRVGSWPLDRLEGNDLKRMVRRSYRRGRSALDLCSSTPSPDLFHLWRKQVKHLWYHLRITAPYWKGEARDLIAVTGRIGQLAGDERDLTLLGEFVKHGPRGRAHQALMAEIEDRLPSLRNKAIEAGAEFYGHKPRIFVRDLDL
jgi:CHAD domain-containing protein